MKLIVRRDNTEMNITKYPIRLNFYTEGGYLCFSEHEEQFEHQLTQQMLEQIRDRGYAEVELAILK